MANTHQLSSSIKLELYAAPYKASQILGEVDVNSQIELLEEKVGFNCSFIKISSSFGVGYIDNTDITYIPLDTIYTTAPSMCPTINSNLSYIEPEWFNLTDEQPYLNEKTLDYSVCVTADNYLINRSNDSSIIQSGIKSLFKFYNKPYDEESLNTYKNYYLFSSIKDYHLSYRPFQRSKYLVSIPMKYFDAIDDNLQVSRDLSNANYVFKISLKEKTKFFTNLKRSLIIYRDNIFFANTTIKFRNPFIEGQQFVTAENSLKPDLDLQQKIDSVEDFEIQLDNLLSLNSISTSLSEKDPSEIDIQFAINNECNKIYNMSVNINGVCKNLSRGLDAFLNKESVSDPTIVNFIKNIQNIYFIEICKVPWYEFIESYVYPETEILVPTQEPNETNYEVFLRAYKAFIAFNKNNSTNPLKTYEQLVQENADLILFQTQLLSDKVVGFFNNVNIYEGDNFFNPINIQKTLTTFRRMANDIGIETSSPYFFAIKTGEVSDLYTYVDPPLGNDLEPDGWTLSQKQPDFLEPIYEIYSVTPKAYVIVGETKYPKTLYRVRENSKKKKQTFNEVLNEIYKTINKIGICKITDFANECLLLLMRNLDVDIDSTITFGVMKNYTYRELMFEILPYLPNDQQQFIYEQLLLELKCVNKQSLLYILKTNISQEEYTSLNLDNASYEDVIKEITKKMVGITNE